jgi:thiol-disulfide isomerase/thioredoxin
MTDFTRPIGYLENSDFDSEGTLVNPNIPKDIPVVIMMQASWCGYCQKAKPAFQQFADQNQGKVFCATIQADGVRPSEKALGKRIPSIKKGFRGFPEYVLYKAGSPVDKQITGRDVEHLKVFASV